MLRLPNPLKMLLVMIACLAPQKIWAGQVDTASIHKILASENLPQPDPMNDETSSKMLDSIATSETRHLDGSNKNWKPSSPKWKPVYDHIRAELESELPDSITIRQIRLKMQQGYEADIASHLSQSDVDSILAYYSKPEGQRYQDFKRRIDQILYSGVRLLSHEDVQSTAAPPAPEPAKQYARMLALSHIAEAVGGDTSDATVLHVIVAAAIKENPQELEALGREYGNDLSGFEAFSGSGAAQHFFVAMQQATSDLAKNNSLADSVNAVEQKHASEWKALYLAQIGDSPSAEIPGQSENPTRFVEVPGGRLALPQKLRLSSGVAVRNLVYKVEPEYPQEAKIAHVQGDVVLQEVISREGDVAELHLVSGHPLLVKAAMDAVKQWRYKPYLLNGYPVEVETTVVIRFHM